ncbi:MAG: hypothetical protein H0W88_11045 [Parachlamydiaceae bacterium]|nr:hypothetical protein [Parachlamydiaceae bacterium]
MIRKLIHVLFIRSWWVIAFIIFCGILYERGMQKRDIQFQHLSEQLVFIQKDKQKALQHQKKLQMQVNSQSDLAWVELALMKGLGVCPEDQQKVYFYK